MKPYPDANLLVRVYLDMPGSEVARRLLRAHDPGRDGLLPVTTILRMEILNALQRMVFESHHGGPAGVTMEIAAAAQAYFDEDLRCGQLFHPCADELVNLEDDFRTLAERHTAKHGFRTYDLLHVAWALRLGCDTFWSFDEKARKLAVLEGLSINL